VKTILEVLQEKNKGWETDDYWSFSASYEDAFHDCEMLVWQSVGSCQGDYFALVKTPDGQYGFTVIGYGSCSGCDGLQATMGYSTEKGEREAKFKEVAQYLQGFRDGAHWEPTKERMKEYLEKECDREMKETYISDEEEKKVLWPKLIKAVS
jgi:hypothetical protein